MTKSNINEHMQSNAKKKLIADLKQAIALANEIEIQAKNIAKIVQDHHRLPLAA